MIFALSNPAPARGVGEFRRQGVNSPRDASKMESFQQSSPKRQRGNLFRSLAGVSGE